MYRVTGIHNGERWELGGLTLEAAQAQASKMTSGWSGVEITKSLAGFR